MPARKSVKTFSFHRHSRWLYSQQQSSSSFRVETSCSITRLLEDEELCC